MFPDPARKSKPFDGLPIVEALVDQPRSGATS